MPASEYTTRYYGDGRLTLMAFWRAAKRRRWFIFPVLTVADRYQPAEDREAIAMGLTWSQEKRGSPCPCGKRKTVNVVVEFILNGRFDYAGSRLCYNAGTEIHYAIPKGAQLTEIRIYDWREPEEMIRVTASPLPEAAVVPA